MMKPTNAVQGLASGAAAVTMALTATAFWLSYEHLHDVAADNGLAGARAWAWPGTVDMFIVAGELLILRAALRGRFDGFAYLLAGVGSLGSIALNVAGVGWGLLRLNTWSPPCRPWLRCWHSLRSCGRCTSGWPVMLSGRR